MTRIVRHRGSKLRPALPSKHAHQWTDSNPWCPADAPQLAEIRKPTGLKRQMLST